MSWACHERRVGKAGAERARSDTKKRKHAANVGRRDHERSTRLTALGATPAASAQFANQPQRRKRAGNVRNRDHETSTRLTTLGVTPAASAPFANQPQHGSLWNKSHAVCVKWKSPRIISLATTGSAASDDVQLANLQRDLRPSAARVQSGADDNGRRWLRMHQHGNCFCLGHLSDLRHRQRTTHPKWSD